MERELKFDGVFYIKMKDGETEEEADKRLHEILESAGVNVLDSYDTEVYEY
jgi:hypothetical protein